MTTVGYGPRLSAVFDQCARQVARLLRGAKVIDVPVEQPTKLELVVNLKTAKMMSVEMAPSEFSIRLLGLSRSVGTSTTSPLTEGWRPRFTQAEFFAF
jgi:hypothetical protein